MTIPMYIVPQCPTFLYSFFPPFPLLAAPPVLKCLPAPRIAGLLAAPVEAKPVEVIIEQEPTFEEILQQLGPLRSIEEMDAEIADMVAEMRRNFNRTWFERKS
ncbi:MAG: hypothetical protein ABI947_01255 [Chloroflexota bacterium]